MPGSQRSMSEPDRPDVDDPRSSAEQREAELGGSGSLLVRQRKDHALLDELLARLRATDGTERERS